MEDVTNKIRDIFSNTDLESFESLFNTAQGDLSDWKPSMDNSEGLIDVIDFFSGCGGMSLGFSALAQHSNLFRLKGAVDINSIALESYRSNFGCKTLNKNIRELCNDEGIKLIRDQFELPQKKERPLVVIGCAPCQGFSNHRKKNWDKKDERNTLIGAFIESTIKLQPDFFVMENVPEILGKKYWAHYEEARSILESQGYTVKQTIYNCAAFGVPQARFRAVIIASKLQINLPSPVLEKEQFKTVRDAIFNLPKVESGQVCATDKYHRSTNHKASTIATISKVPKDGGSRPVGVGPKCLDKVKGFSDVYGRLFWDKPSITLTQYARNPASGRFTHPELNRGLTIREAARLQSFPDTFEFKGTLDQCFKQIGESVPPLLSIAIAAQISLALASKTKPLEVPEVKSINAPVSCLYTNINILTNSAPA